MEYINVFEPPNTSALTTAAIVILCASLLVGIVSANYLSIIDKKTQPKKARTVLIISLMSLVSVLIFSIGTLYLNGNSTEERYEKNKVAVIDNIMKKYDVDEVKGGTENDGNIIPKTSNPQDITVTVNGEEITFVLIQNEETGEPRLLDVDEPPVNKVTATDLLK